MDRDSGFVDRLEVIDTGRRRRWSVAEKQRIVEESLAGHRQASATARRHGIPNGLLFKWRKAWRAGQLGGVAAPTGFVPAVLTASEAEPVADIPAGGGRMEIVLAGGLRIVVRTDVDGTAQRRVLDVLEGRR